MCIILYLLKTSLTINYVLIKSHSLSHCSSEWTIPGSSAELFAPTMKKI